MQLVWSEIGFHLEAQRQGGWVSPQTLITCDILGSVFWKPDVRCCIVMGLMLYIPDIYCVTSQPNTCCPYLFTFSQIPSVSFQAVKTLPSLQATYCTSTQKARSRS